MLRIIGILSLALAGVSQLVFPRPVARHQPATIPTQPTTDHGHQTRRSRVNVVTQDYDGSRTGANLNESVLNTSNINPAQFGKLFTRPVDGYVYAQPLVVSGLAIPGKGVHNVVFVATEHNSVYAYDADDANATSPLWQVNFGAPVPSRDIDPDYVDLTPEIGITSTPVIDADSGTMYVVAKTKEGSGYHQRLHALDLGTGNEKLGGPVEIRASVAGKGSGGASGRLNFDPLFQLNRPALLLSNGLLYLGFGSQGDYGPWHGWLMAYNASTLNQSAVFCTTPNGIGSGIWGAGQGVTADASGNIYVSTGNGTYNTTGQSGSDYGDSVIKLSPSLSVIDWFTAQEQATLEKDDMDLGSGGPLLLPGTSLLVMCGKDGFLRLIDTNGMGKFDPSGDNNPQEFQAVSGHFMGRPVYWNSPNNGPVIYMWGDGDFLKAYKFDGSRFQLAPVSQSGVRGVTGYSNSAPLSLSSNGDQQGTAVLWASCPDQADANHQTVHGILRAFDATDLTRELWDSTMNPGRDDVGNYAKFCPPVVANGKVYEASFSGVLNVYGLLPDQSQCVTINPATETFGTPGGSGSISVRGGSECGWTASSNVDWITIKSGSAGSGIGAVNYSVDQNEGPARSGTVTIGGQVFSVSQTSGCWFAVDQTRMTFGLDGGSGTISVSASTGACVWSATSDSDWITIDSEPSGTGDGTVNYTVAPKSRGKRSGNLTVGGQSVTILQRRN
jgi:hypothetical protein